MTSRKCKLPYIRVEGQSEMVACLLSLSYRLALANRYTHRPPLKLLSLTVIFTACLCGCNNTAVLSSIPEELRGTWHSQYSDLVKTMRIDGRSVTISSENGSYTCQAEELVAYNSGFFSSRRMLSVVCDRTSTDHDQEFERSTGLNAPDDYRKRYRISFPKDKGQINVSETKWMSQGWSGSEGVYEWVVDDFYRS